MSNTIINGGASPYPKHVGPAAICSFSDGAQDAPLKSLKFYISPKQDLHGYSYPWPGGGGKNLINFPDIAQTTSNGVTYSMSGGVLSINGTATGGVVIYPTQAARDSATYTMSAQLLSGSMSGTNSSFSVYSTGSTRRLLTFGNTGVTTKTTFTGDIVAANAGIVINSGAVFTNAKIAFQVEAGSDMTAFAPYSNICPISGWSQVDGVAAGENLFDFSAFYPSATKQRCTVTQAADGKLTATATATGGMWVGLATSVGGTIPANTFTIPARAGMTFATSFAVTGFYEIDASGKVLKNTTQNSGGYTVTEAACVKLGFRINFGSATSVGQEVSGYLCLVPGSTAPSSQTPTPAYSGTPIAISLGQTVYGGTVDAIAGKLVVDRTMVTFDGSETGWNKSGSALNGYYKGMTGSPYYAKANTAFISDKFSYTANRNTYFNNYGKCYCDTAFNFNVDPAVIGGNTVALWKAWLAANPLQVVYELATPIEVDLTPVSGLTSLLGQNNVWANTGDTEVDYYPAAASVVAVLNRSSKVYTSIPLGKIRYDTYQTTPNQALDLDSYRAETGVLIRNVLSHTATKIEFNTPSMTNLQWEEVWNIIKAGFNNSTERKLKLKYYDQMSATFKTGWFYVPDVNFTVRNIDEANGIINYDEIRVAFIEY